LKFFFREDLMPPPKRLTERFAFPPYAFVPGFSPHPRSHPEGHSYGKKEENVLPLDPVNWQEAEMYLYGIDLFNSGYYWEAHEAWEALWHSAGKEGTTADFLKALIKLTAAAVKIRQGQPGGIREHARRAALIFQEIKDQLGRNYFAGLNLGKLVWFSASVMENAESWQAPAGNQRVILFDFFLEPK
jgi:hypothetical protein